jgi:replicative DNA helicase
MPSLAERAEQAVLGALLHDHTLIDRIPYLAADDFADATHRAIYLAISDVHLTHTATAGHRFTALVAADVPAADPTYLYRLPEMCPEPDHLAAYARMVTEAALIRELNTHADRIARGAADLVRHADRLRSSGAVTARERAFPDHLAKLAQAMKQQAARLNPDRRDSAAKEPSQAPDGWPTEPQARREAQVLADLLQHPDECEQVMGWLPAQTFIPGPRREIYEAMRAVVRTGLPVDALTVAWKLGSWHASAGITGRLRSGTRIGQGPGRRRPGLRVPPRRSPGGTWLGDHEWRPSPCRSHQL